MFGPFLFLFSVTNYFFASFLASALPAAWRGALPANRALA